ncbi:WhiB family transcriptional regulator [Salinispora arenicola]|uniref:WhiB family transcriptional regulator n=1 Tax=Salinispora arenicola TaxID=168697 RepID=UPI000476BF85|nr:WhiB family transcriptional regulator [Salinispora arenicola]
MTAESSSVLEKRIHARGLCTNAVLLPGIDPWFPATQSEPALEEVARRVCAGCPVMDECAELAFRREAGLPRDRIHGIFGGLAPHERIAVIKARRARSGEVAR